MFPTALKLLLFNRKVVQGRMTAICRFKMEVDEFMVKEYLKLETISIFSKTDVVLKIIALKHILKNIYSTTSDYNNKMPF